MIFWFEDAAKMHQKNKPIEVVGFGTPLSRAEVCRILGLFGHDTATNTPNDCHSFDWYCWHLDWRHVQTQSPHGCPTHIQCGSLVGRLVYRVKGDPSGAELVRGVLLIVPCERLPPNPERLLTAN